jgi:molybdopterin molybdotransferase
VAELLSVAEARTIVLEHTQPLPAESTPLTPAVLGQVLAEDITSDLDMPPYDKAMMDGYALRSADVAGGQARLEVIEEVMAGMVPARVVEPGQATRIMTGAPIPHGADAVVQIEHTHLHSARSLGIDTRPVRSGHNVLARGQEMKRGDTVLSAGARLRPQEFGILATVGRTTAKVYPAPRVAILSTGDEIVEADQTPGPGQIRNGNGPMLMAQTQRAAAQPRYLGNARDTRDSLRTLIASGLEDHVLVLSGGVSAGKLDLVPSVLEELGVKAHFHKVAMKPGKPILFGTLTTGNRQPATLVFGLPGNPVSSYVCFELFVRPALRRLRGVIDVGPRFVEAALAEDYSYRSDRPTYHPAWLETADLGRRARPVPWFGSPDLRGLARANAFVVLQPSQEPYRAGQICSVMCVEESD